MDTKLAKLIGKLRNKYPEQLNKEPLLDELEDEVLGSEEDMMDEGEGEEGPEMDDEEGVTPPIDINGIAGLDDEDEEEEEDLLV